MVLTKSSTSAILCWTCRCGWKKNPPGSAICYMCGASKEDSDITEETESRLRSYRARRLAHSEEPDEARAAQIRLAEERERMREEGSLKDPAPPSKSDGKGKETKWNIVTRSRSKKMKGGSDDKDSSRPSSRLIDTPVEVCRILTNSYNDASTSDTKVVVLCAPPASDSSSSLGTSKEEDPSDCTLLEFHLHRSILAGWSAVFAEKLCKLPAPDDGERYVLKLDEIREQKDWEVLFKFFYSATIRISEHNVFELLELAKVYKIDSLQVVCLRFIDKGVDKKNCCTLLRKSVKFGVKELESKCVETIMKWFDRVAKTDDFLYLSWDLLYSCLKDKRLRTGGEHLVYGNMLRWISHDFDHRAMHMEDLLNVIRFFAMLPSELALLEEPAVCKELFTELQLKAFMYDADEKMFESEKEKNPELFTGRLGAPDTKELFGCTKKIEEYVVKYTGLYRITAKGAKGADGPHKTGGKGAIISAQFKLKKGSKLEFLVGEKSTTSSSNDSGGGGGTFVSIDGRRNPLIVAGGGGGTRGTSSDADGTDASLTENGSDGAGSYHASGGTAGNGGSEATSSYGGGGAGYFGDGTGTAKSFVNGGAAGNSGGFGGGGPKGGNGGGGGGGYSGGGGGQGGGGGGSYVRDDATKVEKSVGCTGDGELIIEYLE